MRPGPRGPLYSRTEMRLPLAISYHVADPFGVNVFWSELCHPRLMRFELFDVDEDFAHVTLHYSVTQSEQADILTKAARHPGFVVGGLPYAVEQSRNEKEPVWTFTRDPNKSQAEGLKDNAAQASS